MVVYGHGRVGSDFTVSVICNGSSQNVPSSTKSTIQIACQEGDVITFRSGNSSTHRWGVRDKSSTKTQDAYIGTGSSISIHAGAGSAAVEFSNGGTDAGAYIYFNLFGDHPNGWITEMTDHSLWTVS